MTCVTWQLLFPKVFYLWDVVQRSIGSLQWRSQNDQKRGRKGQRPHHRIETLHYFPVLICLMQFYKIQAFCTFLKLIEQIFMMLLGPTRIRVRLSHFCNHDGIWSTKQIKLKANEFFHTWKLVNLLLFPLNQRFLSGSIQKCQNQRFVKEYSEIW